MSQISIGIFGLGRFGTALVHTLNNLDAGKSIHLRIIDNDPEKVEPLRGVTDDQLIVDFDNEDETTLKKHFEGLDVAVIAIGENTLPVIELATVAHEYRSENPDFHVFCRAHDEMTEKILTKLGISKSDLFCPEQTAAEYIGRKAIRPGAAQFPPLAPDQALICIETPEKWQNKSLVELKIPETHKANLMCIVKENDQEQHVETPLAHTPLEKGDKLYLLGNLKTLEELKNLQ